MAPLPDPPTTMPALILPRIPSIQDLSNDPTTITVRTLISRIIPRDGTKPAIDPSKGVIQPESFNQRVMFILFGVLGVVFAVSGVWFFFWAKNGGLYYKKNDWSEYKSTVLRKRGPNGTTLSGATTITDLGGGSVVHGQWKGGKSLKGGAKNNAGSVNSKGVGLARSLVYGPRAGKMKKREQLKMMRGGKKGGKKMDILAQERYKDFDDESSVAGSQSEMSEIKWQAQKDAANKGKQRASRLRGGDLGGDDGGGGGGDGHVHFTVQEAIRSYRHERPARVGGLNKESESSSWEGSTQNDGSTVSGSGIGSEDYLMSNRERTPTNTPEKKVRKERKDNYTGGLGSPGAGKNNAAGIRKIVPSGTKDGGGFWSRGGGGGAGASFSNNAKDKKKEAERVRAEARKLQDKGRSAASGNYGRGTTAAAAAGRRDFSWQAGAPDDSTVAGSRKESTGGDRREQRRYEREKQNKIPGSWDGSAFDSEVGEEVTGTKSYQHHIPGLSGGGDYTEERRKARGYRRDV